MAVCSRQSPIELPKASNVPPGSSRHPDCPITYPFSRSFLPGSRGHSNRPMPTSRRHAISATYLLCPLLTGLMQQSRPWKRRAPRNVVFRSGVGRSPTVPDLGRHLPRVSVAASILELAWLAQSERVAGAPKCLRTGRRHSYDEGMSTRLRAHKPRPLHCLLRIRSELNLTPRGPR